MEERKEFINRMQWMISEIRNSKLDDTNILSMVEYQLKIREKALITDVKRKVVGSMEKKTTKYLWLTNVANDKFLDIIDDL